MENRYQMQSFNEEVAPFLQVITNDVYLESIWLSVMSMLEEIAALYILSNITDKTPTDSLREILTHIKDEQRHAAVLLSLRPVTTYPDLSYYKIEEQLKKIGQEFIMSFFNSTQLRNAKHRYAAYIHGAQTIERFPFRIYSLYLSMTKLSKVKDELPAVIADEIEHIALGKKMYAQLSPDERMPLAELYKLEETVCLMMLKRMSIALKNHLQIATTTVESLPAKVSLESKKFEIAFNHALYIAEGFFSKERAEYLQVAITLSRLEYKRDSDYKKLEKTLVFFVTQYVQECVKNGVSFELIQLRFNKHYNEMIYNTDTMALHYAYHCLLDKHPVVSKSEANMKVEEEIWHQFNTKILQEAENENGLSLSWA